MFVRVFEHTGFTGGLNWYRNFDRNWEATADRGFDRVAVAEHSAREGQT